MNHTHSSLSAAKTPTTQSQRQGELSITCPDCKVQLVTDGDDFIRLCSLHASAPALYAALKRIQVHYNQPAKIKAIVTEAIDLVEKANHSVPECRNRESDRPPSEQFTTEEG